MAYGDSAQRRLRGLHDLARPDDDGWLGFRPSAAMIQEKKCQKDGTEGDERREDERQTTYCVIRKLTSANNQVNWGGKTPPQVLSGCLCN